MNTGDISRRLGFPINTEALVSAGIAVAGKDKRSTLFDDEWSVVCEKLSAYIMSRVDAQAVAKPAAVKKEPAVKPAKSVPVKAATPAMPATSIGGDDDWEDEDEEL